MVVYPSGRWRDWILAASSGVSTDPTWACHLRASSDDTEADWFDPASVDLTRPNVHRHPYGWPLAWTCLYGGGRVFYTALGHRKEVWKDERFQKHLFGGLDWATGIKAGDTTPSKK